MNIVGIVAEYNPFHNGHYFHLQKAKEKAQADYSVAIMSSSFVQRGEPGIFSKWHRAEMAVANGVDLIIELPVLYSSRSAYYFAFGSVFSLIKSRVISHLAFGVEADDMDSLKKIAAFLSFESNSFKNTLHHYLKEGHSYPKAREMAILEHFPEISFSLNQPNVILAINYLKVLNQYQSDITPVSVERLGSYHGVNPVGNIAGATFVRNLLEGNNSKYQDFLTPETNKIIDSILDSGFNPAFLKDFDQQLMFLLRSASKEKLMIHPGIKEGLENKILGTLFDSHHISEVIKRSNSKRYTETRIKRTLIEILLGITYQDNLLDPQYLRILAFNKKGREILKKIKKESTLPVVTKFADFYHQAGTEAKRIMDLDLAATNIYSQIQQKSPYNAYNQEFTTSPLYLK